MLIYSFKYDTSNIHTSAFCKIIKNWALFLIFFCLGRWWYTRICRSPRTFRTYINCFIAFQSKSCSQN